MDDQNQFTEYQKVLGGEGPKTFDEFQEIKYNDPDKWEYLERFVEYKRKYPTSNEKYFGVLEELKAWGVKKGVPLPPIQKQAFILPEGMYDPYHIMHRMVERNLTDDDVRSYIKDARCMFAQWGGKRLRFVGDEGICVITKVGEEWVFKTAWSKQDFDAESDKIMEVLKNAGL